MVAAIVFFKIGAPPEHCCQNRSQRYEIMSSFQTGWKEKNTEPFEFEDKQAWFPAVFFRKPIH